MNARKWITLAAGALIAGSAGAQIVPPVSGYTIEVEFASALERRMASINATEQRLEAEFRDRRHDRDIGREAGTQRFAAERTAGTEWAGERLIEAASDFTLDNLVRALVAYSVNRAAPEFRGRVEVRIDRLQVTDSPVAYLSSPQSFAVGTITVTSADGTVLADQRIRVNLVVDPTVDPSYDGPELAFGESDPVRRVGPTLAQFIERGLEMAWPDRADAIAGPVVVRVTGPNERWIGGR